MVGVEVDGAAGEPREKNGEDMSARRYDHIDLRVKDFARARKFYGQILPALGFKVDRSDPELGTFYAGNASRPADFFCFSEDPTHRPNGTRIAFWAETREEVDCFATAVRAAGGLNLEGPAECPEYTPGYYALFFEDPDGNKLEICSRKGPITAGPNASK
jgi:catechol 2,3-dioxygenase-like lactoylglutathione lyase family enzyme